MLAALFIEYASTNQRYFFAVIITVIVSICVHELTHGVVAIMLGDRTPIETHHMTLNPIVHMGIPSLIMLLVAGIAWGAMPIDPRRLKGKYGEACVALAGPVSNVLMALIALGVMVATQRFQFLRSDSDFAKNAQYLLVVFGRTNFALAILNLIPVPPLDGSRVLAGISPSMRQTMDGLRQSGMTLLIVVFMFAGTFIWKAADWLSLNYVMFLRGHS